MISLVATNISLITPEYHYDLSQYLNTILNYACATSLAISCVMCNPANQNAPLVNTESHTTYQRQLLVGSYNLLSAL